MDRDQAHNPVETEAVPADRPVDPVDIAAVSVDVPSDFDSSCRDEMALDQARDPVETEAVHADHPVDSVGITSVSIDISADIGSRSSGEVDRDEIHDSAMIEASPADCPSIQSTSQLCPTTSPLNLTPAEIAREPVTRSTTLSRPDPLLLIVPSNRLMSRLCRLTPVLNLISTAWAGNQCKAHGPAINEAAPADRTVDPGAVIAKGSDVPDDRPVYPVSVDALDADITTDVVVIDGILLLFPLPAVIMWW